MQQITSLRPFSGKQYSQIETKVYYILEISYCVSMSKCYNHDYEHQCQLCHCQCHNSWSIRCQLIEDFACSTSQPQSCSSLSKIENMYCIFAFYKSNFNYHMVSPWTITVSSLGPPSPQHEARQEKTSTVPNSTGGPSTWGGSASDPCQS